MPSIDHFCLQLFLMRGIIACAVFVILMLWLMIRLVAYDMRRPAMGKPGSCLTFTLASIILACLIAVTTVCMGM